jgi:hypothetical protein
MMREKIMFRIPSFYQENFDFDFAVQIMKGRANGDLLEGLKSMDKLWADYIALPGDEQDDDEFYSNWSYEVNAYNVVVEKMRPLFV